MAYRPDRREYRSFNAGNFSAAEAPEEEQSYIVEGYATTFNDPYELAHGMFEVIDRNALAAADMSDVIVQYNHAGMVLARMSNGSLQLVPDDHGILCRMDLSGTRQGRDLYEAIKNGLVTQMSWGFTVADDGWEYDRNTRTSTVTKVAKVYDVSAVSIPANAGAEIKARSYLDGVIEAERQELSQREKDMDRRKRIALLMQVTAR